MKSFTREKKIGSTTFMITSECSPTATETVEQKLERIICRHSSDIKDGSAVDRKSVVAYAGSLSMSANG